MTGDGATAREVRDHVAHGLRRKSARKALLAVVASIFVACPDGPEPRVGSPAGGPYRVTLAFDPPRPVPGEETELAFRIEHMPTGEPVVDLQVIHERVLHTFIVARDFRHFAHTHHEDFAALAPGDLATATFRYPHVFPYASGYRVVVEFTHRDRSWWKHFEVKVGDGGVGTIPELEPRSESRAGGRRFTLRTKPSPPRAGTSAELILRVETESGDPVTDLAMVLGSEAHMATWRADGRHFGHAHAWTPEMEAAMRAMEHHAGDAAASGTAPMVTSGTQYFHGPEVPLRYAFPEPGRYAVFLDLAPGGERTVASFVVEVVP